jgi:N-ethylmaleimide reductase
MRYPHLLSAGRVGDLELPNRMVMSPMTRFRVEETGAPMPLNALYYGQRASAGLIVGEFSYAEPRGRCSPRAAGIACEDHVAAWRVVTDEVHGRGGRMFLQVGHAGRVSHPALQPNGELPVAPSSIAKPGEVRITESVEDGVVKAPAPTPRALEVAEIAELTEEFGRATARAQAAGFDGVELHAGSGFLHQQFLTLVSNQRTDAYGGGAANRCRFLIETLEAMCAVRGPGRVGVKIAPNFAYHGMDMAHADVLETYGLLARELDRLGLAYVHVQYPPWGLFYGPRDFNPIPFIREHFAGTLLGAGEFDRDSAEAALRDGTCDLVAFGRRFIANPDLPERIRLAAEENGWDEARLYGPTAEHFTDFPVLG